MSSPSQNIGGFLAACEVEFEELTVMFFMSTRISAFDYVFIYWKFAHQCIHLFYTILFMYTIVPFNN